MSDTFRNIMYFADRGGCSKWRRQWAVSMIDCYAQGSHVQADYSQTPILDARYYKNINSVTVQRWISDYHRDVIDKFLRPLTLRSGAWLIYEIDDLMDDEYIPLFNRGRMGFENKKVQENITHMLNTVDLVTVTTDYIKNAYHKHYGVPLNRIVALPNMLPRYLFGDRYDLNKKLVQFKKFKAKPRIGVISSLSHYNISDVRQDKDGLACRKQTSTDKDGKKYTIWINENNVDIPENETFPVEDDMDLIIQTIRDTVNDFQWVMFGYAPPKLKDLIDKGKIEVHGGSPIMTYASVLENLSLQAVVAPIQDIEFNRCKSPIKYMECAALGIPLLASNALPYSGVMPERQLFKDGNDLKDKLLKLKFMSTGAYSSLIEHQWKWLNTPCHEGDFDLKNFWLEDNLDIWMDLFRMRNRCINCSLDVYLRKKKQKEDEENKKVIYKNNDVEILR